MEESPASANLNLPFTLNGVLLRGFPSLTPEESELVLSWRNHPDIRRWMLTNTPISLESHNQFIDSLKKATDKFYWLAYSDETPVGVIYLTDIDWTNLTGSFGIYAGPGVRGFGRKLGQTLLDICFGRLGLKTVLLEVFTDNAPAINLYRKLGFVETGNDGTLLKMMIDRSRISNQS